MHTLQNPLIRTSTLYKTHTHTLKAIHYKAQTYTHKHISQPHINTTAHYKHQTYTSTHYKNPHYTHTNTHTHTYYRTLTYILPNITKSRTYAQQHITKPKHTHNALITKYTSYTYIKKNVNFHTSTQLHFTKPTPTQNHTSRNPHIYKTT